MNRKKIALFSLILLIGLSSLGFARQGNAGNKPRRRESMHGMEDSGKRPHPRKEWFKDMFARLIGLDEILDQYDVKMRRIFLDAKEKSIALRKDMRACSRKLRKIKELYKKNPNKYKDELYTALVEIRTFWAKKDAIQKKAMRDIGRLVDEKDKEVDAALNKWIDSAKGNTKKLDQFVDVFEDMFE